MYVCCIEYFSYFTVQTVHFQFISITQNFWGPLEQRDRQTWRISVNGMPSCQKRYWSWSFIKGKVSPSLLSLSTCASRLSSWKNRTNPQDDCIQNHILAYQISLTCCLCLWFRVQTGPDKIKFNRLETLNIKERVKEKDQANMVVLWLSLSSYSKNALGSKWGFPCVWVGSLRVLRCPPAIQRHTWVNVSVNSVEDW